MSGQDWNTVLNRVLAVQAAETDVARANDRLRDARWALNEAVNRRDESIEWESLDGDLRFVVGSIEYTVSLPDALLGPATVTERALNVITLNK